MIDEESRVTWSAAHGAWNQIQEQWFDDAHPRGRRVSSPFRGLGQYYDVETQLSCTRYRYWEAETGRWLSADPLGILGGLNLFGFGGRPTVDIDPLGLACEDGKGGSVAPVGAPEENVQEFIRRFQERYPGRPFKSGHVRTHSDGRELEIDFETDNVIIEFKASRGTGLSRQVRDRTDSSVNPSRKPVIGLATSSKGPSKHVRKDVEAEGGLLGGKDDIDDILDMIAP